MMLSRTLVVVMIGALSLSGCGNSSQWEITVENTGTSPCSVYVTLGYAGGGAQGTSKASIKGVGAGKQLSLLVGDSPRTIESIRIIRGDDEELIEPNTKIQRGGRFAIVVPAAGKSLGCSRVAHRRNSTSTIHINDSEPCPGLYDNFGRRRSFIITSPGQFRSTC